MHSTYLQGSYYVRIGLLALAYLILGEASFQVSVSHNIVTLVVFAAEGAALAAVLHYGPKVWPGIFIGQLILALHNGVIWDTAIGISLINSLEAVIAVTLFRRLGLRPDLERLRDIGGLILLIFLVLQPFSATLGVSLLWARGVIPDTELGWSWFSWWLGNSMGQVLVTPLLLSVISHKAYERLTAPNILLLIFTAILAVWLLFRHEHPEGMALEFAIFTPLIAMLAALGGMFAATLITTGITTLTLIATANSSGPFTSEGTVNILELNLFLIGTTLTAQLIAALFEERRQDKEALQRYIKQERARTDDKQRQLETQLQQSQKMEAIGRLAGGIAHDYNNMLSIIIGYAQLAKSRLNTEEEAAKDIDQILTAAYRSAEITGQLLAYARKQTISPRVITLDNHITDAIEMLRRLIGENITIEWKPQDDTWPIMIDPTQVEQVLTNLCINARDAITGAGEITITTNNTTLSETDCEGTLDCKPGDYVLLTISDSGRGMSEEELAHIFDPFYTTKHLSEGAGLGMSVIYGIIQQNNGFITVNSEQQKGTRIGIYLPRHSETVEKKYTEKLPDTQDHQGGTVLLAEDEPAVLALTYKLLDDLGYQVLATTSPIEAIELAKQHDGPISLLVTDVIMPNMSGVELSETITAMQPNLLTIYMSGYSADELSHTGVLEKDTHLIQKPFTTTEFSKQIQSILATQGKH